MAVFRYQGRDKTGKSKSGRITADNRKEAILKLRENGIAVRTIEELTSILYKEINFGTKKIKSKDFVLYLRQFSTLLKAGVSLVDATHILAKQTSNKVLKKTLLDLVQSLEEGKPYSDGAEKHRNVFPPMFVNMMRAGEAGGNMDEILDRMAEYYEKHHRTMQKVISAMTYPITVAILTVVIVIFLLATVVPTFANMLESFGGELPWITRVVIHIGSFFQSFWWLFVLLVIGFYVVYRLIRSNPNTKYYLDYGMLKIPIFGILIQKAELSRFTRTLSSLFNSSVPILQSLTILERVINNEVIKRVLRESRESIQSGESMAVPMEKHWAFPPMVTQMIAIGEKSGTLDMMLAKVADFYDMEVDNATDQIKSLIEPLMVIILAIAVGGVVASVAVPMFSLFETIQ